MGPAVLPFVTMSLLVAGSKTTLSGSIMGAITTNDRHLLQWPIVILPTTAVGQPAPPVTVISKAVSPVTLTLFPVQVHTGKAFVIVAVSRSSGSGTQMYRLDAPCCLPAHGLADHCPA